MSTTIQNKFLRKIPKTYQVLMEMYCIRPIRDGVEYETAMEIAHHIDCLVTINPDQQDYFDLLTDQIEKYERKKYGFEEHMECNPLEYLKFLLKENGMNSSDLGHLLGNRQLGSKILRGERQLSKNHIRILAEHFRVSTDLFILSQT